MLDPTHRVNELLGRVEAAIPLDDDDVHAVDLANDFGTNVESIRHAVAALRDRGRLQTSLISSRRGYRRSTDFTLIDEFLTRRTSGLYTQTRRIRASVAPALRADPSYRRFAMHAFQGIERDLQFLLAEFAR